MTMAAKSVMGVLVRWWQESDMTWMCDPYHLTKHSFSSHQLPTLLQYCQWNLFFRLQYVSTNSAGGSLRHYHFTWLSSAQHQLIQNRMDWAEPVRDLWLEPSWAILIGTFPYGVFFASCHMHVLMRWSRSHLNGLNSIFNTQQGLPQSEQDLYISKKKSTMYTTAHTVSLWAQFCPTPGSHHPGGRCACLGE